MPDIFAKLKRMGAAAGAVLAIGALITAVFSFAAGAFVFWADEQYASKEYVQAEFAAMKTSGFETKQGLYFLTTQVLATEISRLNGEIARLEAEVEGSLMSLSPAQRNYYDSLQEQLRETRRNKRAADQRLRELPPTP